MLVTHPAFYTWKRSHNDDKFSGNNFSFGQGADWCLRDCWEVIIEWKKKIGKDDFSALGEGIEYARRKSFSWRENPAQVAEDVHARRFTRLMIGDSECFYLVLCDRDYATRCIWGEWTDQGSKDAVVDFLFQGFQIGGLKRPWVHAMTRLCKEFNVELESPCEECPTCFLGAGGCGRVFRVRSISDKELFCLKVGLGDIACSQISEEWGKFQQYSSRFGEAHLIQICQYYQCPDRNFAGLLLQPVGQQLPMTPSALQNALNCLLQLSQAGFGHGDARRQNVVWVAEGNGKCVWLDLRTLYSCEQQQEAFVRDVVAFFTSFFTLADNHEEISQQARKCFASGSVEELVAALRRLDANCRDQEKRGSLKDLETNAIDGGASDAEVGA
jgi:hypothetical protein